MTALAEALLTAQRGALAALGKDYIGRPDAGRPVEEVEEALCAIGCTDKLEQAQLIAAWDVLREHGAQAPRTNGQAKPPAEDEPASEAQWTLLRKLADERGKIAPDGPLTKAKASQAINALKAGTYNADDYTAPF